MKACSLPWPCSVPTGALASVAPGAARDPFETSIEQLMDVEVTRLHFHAERRPSAVTVITADDIRDYGYRTLAEALCSKRRLRPGRVYRAGYLAHHRKAVGMEKSG